MLRRTWELLCSLKLAIVLASVATALAMGGSLLMPSRPGVFGVMDSRPLGEWLLGIGLEQFSATWWVFGTCLLLVCLGVNTLCCFLDWLLHLRSRWRKTGEYLIHLGFVLLLAAYLLGSLAGFRSTDVRLSVGQTVGVTQRPGSYLHLHRFEPRFGADGRFLDMVSEVGLLQGDREVARGAVRLNHPLRHGDLVVVPGTFGRQVEGVEVLLAGVGRVPLRAGSEVAVPAKGQLKVHRFYPHAVKAPGGEVLPGGESLGNPALLLEWEGHNGPSWRGWHFLGRRLPAPLSDAGLFLRPLAPLTSYYSVLHVNGDPGADLALAGGVAMGVGVLFALFSFYAKRARRDRPQVE